MGVSEMVSLNADIVGYSALVADDLEALTDTIAVYLELVTEEVTANGGQLDNFVGDQFMAVFDDSMSALSAAIGITTRVEEHNADVPLAKRARFRMGIDRGEVSVTDAGYHGDALNIAARVQAIAPPGGIAVTGRVFRDLDEPSLRFRPMGRPRMKNIPDQIDVHEFVGLPSDADEGARPSALALEAPTVAVLPIHTESADEAMVAAARVVRSDLIHRLSRIPELVVIDADTEPGQTPRAARYMLETGIHSVGTTARVYATLFDVTTMNIVKSHKWICPEGDVVGMSENMAEDVALAIEVDLVVGRPAGLYAALEDPVSIENVYLGWYHLRADTPDGWARAMELFGDVARDHPDQPFGHVLRAFALWIGAAYGWTDAERAFADAMAAAATAREVGDPTGMGQAVEAAVLMSTGSPDRALETLEGLEDVRPTCDVTYGLEGSVRRYMGQWERAVELLDQAMRLTGINKPWYPTVKSAALYVGGRNEDAAAIAQDVLDHQPGNIEALLVLAAAQAEMGLDRRAHATADRVASQFPGMDVADWLDKAPYQRREIVARWKEDLASTGLIAAR